MPAYRPILIPKENASGKIKQPSLSIRPPNTTSYVTKTPATVSLSRPHKGPQIETYGMPAHKMKTSSPLLKPTEVIPVMSTPSIIYVAISAAAFLKPRVTRPYRPLMLRGNM